VTIDIDGLLRRVAAEVFEADVAQEFSTEPRSPGLYRVRLTSPDGRRHAGLRASYEWFDVTVFDTGGSATLYDYDDDADDKEAVLRMLALVVRAYLRGEGRIEDRRGWFRTQPVLTIVVDDLEWELGRRRSRVHYPY
jgi:hypothetical protein